MSTWAERVDAHDVVASTMDEARKLASLGAAEGTSVVALEQRQGRGRRGRHWHSPPGAGLWMTIVLRPRMGPELHTLALVASVAVREAVCQLGAMDVSLKWPNDVVVGRHKLCGILLECDLDSTDAGPTVLVGIGLNLAPKNSLILPPDIADRYVGLHDLIQTTVRPKGEDAAFPRSMHERAKVEVLTKMEAWYHLWTHHGFAAVAPTWQAADHLFEKPLRAEIETGPVKGMGQGIDIDGCLRILTADGTERVRSGEVQRLDY